MLKTTGRLALRQQHSQPHRCRARETQQRQPLHGQRTARQGIRAVPRQMPLHRLQSRREAAPCSSASSLAPSRSMLRMESWMRWHLQNWQLQLQQRLLAPGKLTAMTAAAA